MRDSVVLITGAAGALGSATARRFAAEGARLALLDRSAQALEKAAAALGTTHPPLVLAGVDVTKGPPMAEAVASVVARFGRLDVLVNIAGAYAGGTVLEADASSWDFLMDVNARSVFHACRAAAPLMVAAEGGAIVNVGSPAALAAFAGGGVYAASKAAVLRLTEALSAELKGQGVRVNAVLPGTMDTPANRMAMPGADPARWVTTDEVAEVIVFLASPRARGVHGAAIPVYGRG